MEAGQQSDVLVIGAGPAGLTAAIYAGRALLSTRVMEKAVPGGQLNETAFIENFPGFEEKTTAPELMQQMRKQAERLGAEIVLEEAVRIEPAGTLLRVHGTKRVFETRAIILSCGSRPRELTVDGAARLKGRGVSYCATCDGYFFQGKRILEVGAGDSGLTEALFLSKFAASVTILVRHPEDAPHALRASPILQQRVRDDPKIAFLWNKTVEAVTGEDRLSAVRVRDLGTDVVEDIATDGLFINIGHLPQTDFLRGAVALDPQGYVITDERLRTDVPGVFAAGDIRVGTSRYAQAVIAAGDGAVAAIEAERYLSALQ